MAITGPTLNELNLIAKSLYMDLSDSDLELHLSLLQPNLTAYELIDSLADYVPEVTYPRTSGYAPEPEQNELNAWHRKTSIKGAKSGSLAGCKLVLKDNIFLAGVPMMNGASTLQGYVPEYDATVVSRILNAGGEIVGKAHCEYFCLSGGSHTNSKHPVKNPYNPLYSSGGSSSGCGALVGSGEVDMAIGCDQGGSIRIPASWSGCVGMKPTWGLVPYSGIMPIENTIDNAGPITNNVKNNAKLLQAIAGPDGLDPRQYRQEVDNYLVGLNSNINDLKIGILTDGFNRPESEEQVDKAVLDAVNVFSKLGASVEEVSTPWHNIGQSIWLAIALEGLTDQMMLRNGMGLGWKGLYSTSLIDRHSSWRMHANELPNNLKSCLLTGQYMLEKYNGHFYAKAQNLSRRLTDEYNKLLSHFDILVMPTTPMQATLIPTTDDDESLHVQRAFEMIGNTCPFDTTGHPALSIPCGMRNGLPVGMMLVGNHFDEATLYRAAQAYEQSTDWKAV
ncbi:amidase [Shewanella sp. D64]|uniref:amidase n=1 Tax=unclassified Shewanella TaxID=196818 RepID=UPI0022BA51B1|nr:MULTISPECIES: amidase [unclassified Shewanella]MEC4724973.1 amidase [Shewanella sp. D64]MEC4736874.1 amidase [Shewanella sp. E94]WBJ96472.1 amidase [Shewanella sp. MTB7]